METTTTPLNATSSRKANAEEERDQALEDLRNVETAFSDLHKKYERAKTTLENLKKNEDLLKERDAQMVKKLELKDQHLAKLKEEVQAKLEMMHSDYATKAKSMESEMSKLKALLRKNEMKMSTLQVDLEQKRKENIDLNALCDDLISGNGR